MKTQESKPAAPQARVWIISDGPSARWHVGIPYIGEYDGRTKYHTACQGLTLYSPYGIGTWVGERPSEIEHRVCSKCEGKLARAALAAAE